MDYLFAVLGAFGGTAIATLIVWLAWIRPEDKRIQARIDYRTSVKNEADARTATRNNR